MSNYSSSNYPSPNHPARDQKSSAQPDRFDERAPRDEPYGRTSRDQDLHNWQNRAAQAGRWPQDNVGPRNSGRGNYYGGSSYYGSSGGYEESPYAATAEDGYRAEYAPDYDRPEQGNDPYHGPYRSGRGQHRSEPWPRNEDRENYASVADYSVGGRPALYEDNKFSHTENRRLGNRFAQSRYGHDFDQGDLKYQQDGAGFSRNYGNVQSWQECDNAQTGAFGMQSYRGKGPRGYARSDERIKEDVCERLSEHHYIDATDVSVEVKDGVVTLEGAVGDRWQKYQAEDLTDTISGVKDISNRLTVKRADPRNADNSRVAQTPAKGN